MKGYVALLSAGHVNWRGSNTVKDRRTPCLQTNCTVEKGKYDQTILRTRCRTVVIVVIMDMVTFIEVFMVGFFVTTFDVPPLVLNTRTRCCDTKLESVDFVFFFFTSSNWQSKSNSSNGRWLCTDTHHHAHFCSVVALRRTTDALCTQQQFHGAKSD